ncbi:MULTISPECIES: PLP-dependent aspartate aminotransferase family protein [unclassified Enterococcus]|uniref:trans-sulfuration enzyme family protein n=1 Tax=unclassified Enterococcus TaxID=2608891 RepID=UPI00155578CD|nr:MULTISPECIES: PLP-dependent aspartate aminotransferase family protein [unclassified Enterococcus]MBS7576582.1 PLP-dependent transferase [Enterococcus sp. MMGLQ5-2]MBS7583931.1 PLP-dependent transferase [Enterococcus sp. MMGLQ5-1]NPD11792.1 PLP-dependent transferase [Enterococcus sp. MMGLQ5-1]NPD36419.1 PLP-dependent transferase [Enterococcus sp. MMGLQ5-2]
MEIDTLVVTGISSKENPQHAVVPPIFLTTTYAQAGLEEFGAYQYSRAHNPTRTQLETLVARLEQSEFAFSFASGMAASSAFFSLFQPGDKILINSNIYGGTFSYLKTYLPQYQIDYELIDDLNELSTAHFSKNIKGIFIETPSNPLLRVTDIARVSRLAHQQGAIVAVDNTFLTPYYQRPLELGADLVIYSATKYFGGHADVIAGLVTTNDASLADKIRFYQINQGAILSPFDAYSLIRGIKTLAIRLDRQAQNTKAIIEFLTAHQAIDQLYFAGSFSDNEQTIQARQASGIGAVISFSLKPAFCVKKFLSALERFDLAASLGGVESLIEHVASMSHQSFSQEILEKLGITNQLVRLAVGIENKNDLIADLKQALGQAEKEV